MVIKKDGSERRAKMSEHYDYKNGEFVPAKGMRNAIGLGSLQPKKMLGLALILGVSVFAIYKLSKQKIDLTWE